MLVRNVALRRTVQAVAIAVLLVLFALPFVAVLLGSVASSWSGPVPSGLTLGNFLAVAGESGTLGAAGASLVTAAVATVVAIVLATSAALGARSAPRLRTVVDAAFLLPVAVPSVAIGLAILIAFSSGPVPLNGTVWIVLVAHVVLVSAIAHQPISAAVARLDRRYEESAAALGASPARILLTVVLPQLRPALIAAAALCTALSMGELTAVMMVAPPTWRTLPLEVFSMTSRGIHLYEGAALAVVLMGITLVALLGLGRLARPR
ncbi:ABC transporter permease subunit [Curtobacterium pusillum]|uniref:2-aminoethylphosphonate transport system permease protein n=1 Tax=Curtobacterium pusillum TaxID=69373 RepID=A0AAW3T2E4_9MICO|nr:ABC transporter permease subunit [Curtobacterium pusillum]MBA8989531.1 2-aminoethylphosphonate transport system permease protein [Curtobacterium pusillum]NUU14974.1 ABC transporter permease subunit [Curtobacterium pusillum]GLK32537.1 putative ABC transporter, permease protein [Curtobacterium pusillum]